MEEEWCTDSSVEDKWSAMRTALCEAAESILGTTGRRQADWFVESQDVLKPFFEKREKWYKLWLSSRREDDRKKFASARKALRRAVRKVKNEWFQRKAIEAERGKNG